MDTQRRDLSFSMTDRIARDLIGERFNEFDEESVLGANWLLNKAARDGNCGVSFIKLRNILQRDYAFSDEIIADRQSLTAVASPSPREAEREGGSGTQGEQNYGKFELSEVKKGPDFPHNAKRETGRTSRNCG
jgi:hypothetical protein